ncbi:hypothetical protein J2W42_002261 [Rhizobium tibeticum]|uniref:Uncharacterized protein n=2 Tax=Rhizobium TaxID=379 RepID=A0A1H8M5R2_9HYPH|nr:hypothetical protein [Rhizobium tibeticum]CDM57505.1 putative predicted protein [Rhizobium favelukesii]SEH93995.1 hypothetical protein RTCCBAU85039_3214 [Rhizobium tibeticum]SEO12712.1 hypothetical protein SAMN05216228_101229 [Rhizobium tibeticum]
MERLPPVRSDEVSAYDNYARRLIAHMRESRRLLDSFTLRDDGAGSGSDGKIGGKH